MSKQLSFSALALLWSILASSNLVQAGSPVPFQYSTTLQMNAGSFGRALGEYHGNLLVGSTSSAYLYDIQTGGVVQEYLNAGGIFNSGG